MHKRDQQTQLQHKNIHMHTNVYMRGGFKKKNMSDGSVIEFCIKKVILFFF